MSVEGQYSYYGTPLATGEDSLVTRSKKAAGLKERAIDPQTGKLIRFHGAFTGGFSSGYYNTVSTKEGWTPSQFFSTRAQRSETVRQQPEDYMDEEDFSDQGIAPKRFQPTESYSLTNKVSNSGLRDELTASLFEKTALVSFSNTSSIGFDLMRTMGWREGQGVGPVIRKTMDIKQQEGAAETQIKNETPDTKQRVDKDDINSGGESEGEIIEDAVEKESNPPADQNNYVIAPRDIKESFVAIKDDKMGLGYSGMRAPTSNLLSNHPTNPLRGSSDSERITSLFGGTLNNPYDVDELDSSAGRMEWYRQEPTSDDEDNSFGWTGGGDGLRLASFEQIGNLCCNIPPCKVKIPPNYIPAVTVVTKTTHTGHVQPYTEQSAAARGQLLGNQKNEPKQQFDSSKLKFNPLIQSLGSRFVPAQLPDSVTAADQLSGASGLSTPKQEVKAPKQSKETLEWHPHRILCKRFNIPDPYPSSGLLGVPFRPERLTFSSLMLTIGGTSDSTGTKETSDASGDAVPWCPTSSDHLPSSDQRPPIDLFTSVFGGESSSESEGGGDGDEETRGGDRPAVEGTKQTPADWKVPQAQSESRSSLQVLAQMASKEIEKKKSLEEKMRKRKSKFVEAEEVEGDSLPKFSLIKAFGTDLPPDMFTPGASLDRTKDDSPDHRYNHRDDRDYKRKDRDKDRKYSSRYSSSHHDKRYHNYSSSSSHRRK